MQIEIVRGNPVQAITAAILRLQAEGTPISKKSVEAITPYTRIQIAGAIESDFSLKSLFDAARHHS